MKLQSIRLFLGNIARTTNTKTLPALKTGTIKKKDANGNFTSEIQEYYVECGTRMSDSIKIKFPLSAKADIEKLEEMLKNDMLVEISFSGLKLTAYALQTNNGTLLSGVAGKATAFTIASSESDNFDDLIIED